MTHPEVAASPAAPTQPQTKPERAARRAVWQLWLVARASLSLWALFCSFSFAPTAAEKSVRVWPPRAPLGTWLQRVLLEPWNRWDVEHFLKIATRGYAATDGTSSFHPLFPLLGRAVGFPFGGNALLGMFIVSNVCSLLFLLALERLARFDLPAEAARRAVFYFLLLPTAFILFAPYTESLFLLCATVAWLAARQGRWWWAGLAGGFAVLTRQQGIFLLLPLAYEFWLWSGGTRAGLHRQWIRALNLLLIPAALLLWLLYRGAALSDVSFDWRQPRTLIYGLLISQSTHAVVHQQDFVPPWQTVWIALTHFSLTNAIDLTAGVVFVLLFAAGARRLWRLRVSYFLYVAATLLISFSFSTGTRWSLMGLPRHCLLAFPIVFIPASWPASRPLNLTAVAIGGFCLIFMTMFYVAYITWLP